MDGSYSVNLKFYCFLFLDEFKSPRCKEMKSTKGKLVAPTNSILGTATASGVESSKETAEIVSSRTDEVKRVRKILAIKMTDYRTI